MAKNKQNDTKLSILHCAMKLFLEKGYSQAYVTTIAKQLGISTGNLTFHFPTKEHLLTEIVNELMVFQNAADNNEGDEISPVAAYFRELMVIAAVYEENPNVKDLVTAAYTHSMSLEVIRRYDSQKAVERFGKYCEGWTQKDYIKAESIVSGIEYAMLMTEHTQGISLEERVSSALYAIMMIYQVPEEEGKVFVEQVLAMDYHNIGRNVFDMFCEYIGNRIYLGGKTDDL